MRRTLVATALIFGFLGVAKAECTRPDSPLPLPEGASATRSEMNDAMHRVRDYTDSVNAYLHCLQGEADQLQVGAGTADQQQALDSQAELHNAAVEDLVGVSHCFNEQVRAFKASGGGEGGVETDCAAQLTAADAGADPNSPVQTMDLVACNS